MPRPSSRSLGFIAASVVAVSLSGCAYYPDGYNGYASYTGTYGYGGQVGAPRTVGGTLRVTL